MRVYLASEQIYKLDKDLTESMCTVLDNNDQEGP